MEYSEGLIQDVWEKARATGDQDRGTWRKDECGAWMRREHYGRTQSEFGWKIENVSDGEPETLRNLRPFNCANGFDRANGRAHCRVTADLAHVATPERVLEPRNRNA